jgi:deoxyribose-phosphate aldolase
VIIEMMCLTEETRRVRDLRGPGPSSTGTGWAERATLQDVRLLKSIVGDRIKIKASGGIRSLETLLQMHEAGARRFGINLQSAIQIVEEALPARPAG